MYIIMRAAVQIREIFSFYLFSSFLQRVWIFLLFLFFASSRRSVLRVRVCVCVCVWACVRACVYVYRVAFVSIRRPLDTRVCQCVARCLLFFSFLFFSATVFVTRTFVWNFSSSGSLALVYSFRPLASFPFSRILSYSPTHSFTLTFLDHQREWWRLVSRSPPRSSILTYISPYSFYQWNIL